MIPGCMEPSSISRWISFLAFSLFTKYRSGTSASRYENLPQVLLMENVTQVHGEKNAADFQKWISFLEKKGYSNYVQDINASDFGVAQL